MTNYIESHLEEATLEWLAKLGYELRHGPDITQGELQAERQEYSKAISLIDESSLQSRTLTALRDTVIAH